MIEYVLDQLKSLQYSIQIYWIEYFMFEWKNPNYSGSDDPRAQK